MPITCQIAVITMRKCIREKEKFIKNIGEKVFQISSKYFLIFNIEQWPTQLTSPFLWSLVLGLLALDILHFLTSTFYLLYGLSLDIIFLIGTFHRFHNLKFCRKNTVTGREKPGKLPSPWGEPQDEEPGAEQQKGK